MLKTAGANRAQTGGSIDNTPIGATTPSTGAFTTLSATKAAAGDVITFTNGGATPKVGYLYSGPFFSGLFADANAGGAGIAVITGQAATLYSPDQTKTASISNTGLGVVGILSATGVVTFSNYGAGAATFDAAGVISSVSDETWKTKDGVPTDPDAMLKKLEPGYWYYNDEKKKTFSADRQLGFYAQNVNAAIGPEAAPEPEEGKPWGYYDRSVLAVTVMSLQKALATIESLESRIAALESK